MHIILKKEDKEVILIGTAHVSQESVDLVKSVIEKEKPDTVCVELCPSRLKSIRDKSRWQNTDIVKIIKEKKVFLLLSNLILTSFQKRIAKNLDIKPGAEMLQAISSSEALGSIIEPVDRDIRVTLSRTWSNMSLWDKIKLLFQLIFSFGGVDEISKEEVEKMKEKDVLDSLLSDISKELPVIKAILIDERDQYLAQKIKDAQGNKIVAVVGAGHVPGIKKYWDMEIDISSLEKLPKKSNFLKLVKWIFPLIICAIFITGFFIGGKDTGTDMIALWIAANGIMAGIGALLALAHPFTIVSSIIAAPLTSLNPTIAAGWVSGLVEAFARKPKVKDLENLPNDILSIKGFWKNKVTHILLVVVFTNLGSAIGTFIAIPFMFKAL